MTHNFKTNNFKTNNFKNNNFEKTLLSFDEQNEILRNFPSTIKFSYERRTHKKVLSDLYVIIPKGKKYFAWFTHRNRKNICFFLEVGYQNKIMNIFYRHVSFDSVLSYGTIFYGTLFTSRSDTFSVEDIFYYKGDDISNHNYEQKLKIIKNIFDTQLRYNISFTKNGVVFGLPYTTTDFMQARDIAHILPYSVYSIQYRNLKDINSTQSVIEYYHFNPNNVDQAPPVNYATPAPTPTPTPAIHDEPVIIIKPKIQSNDIYKNFFVKPDLQNDIYYLYQLNATNFDAISKEIAHIPDYKTSVFMNKIFRNIKENNNLDSLEESDEEEEFENIQIDKFVDLNKIIKMRCIFNYKFKKWVPISIL
jgi:hypothetical protein